MSVIPKVARLRQNVGQQFRGPEGRVRDSLFNRDTVLVLYDMLQSNMNIVALWDYMLKNDLDGKVCVVCFLLWLKIKLWKMRTISHVLTMVERVQPLAQASGVSNTLLLMEQDSCFISDLLPPKGQT